MSQNLYSVMLLILYLHLLDVYPVLLLLQPVLYLHAGRYSSYAEAQHCGDVDAPVIYRTGF